MMRTIATDAAPRPIRSVPDRPSATVTAQRISWLVATLMGPQAGMTDAQPRQPTWSGYFTRPMAGWIPGTWRHATLAAIRGIHTAIFVSISAAVALTLWDGVRGRPRRRTAVAGGVVLAESVLYVSNNQVCPLTPLAEELGAERGTVVDLFLPGPVARRIPLVAGSAAVLSLVLNLRALLWRRCPGRSGPDGPRKDAGAPRA